MKKLYCIFSVSDYKGGELHSSVNMSFYKFIGELSEKFYLDNIDNMTIDQIREEVVEKLKDRGFYSTYAGGDGFCGKCYVIEDNNLKSVKIESYVNDIADYIYTNWR